MEPGARSLETVFVLAPWPKRAHIAATFDVRDPIESEHYWNFRVYIATVCLATRLNFDATESFLCWYIYAIIWDRQVLNWNQFELILTGSDETHGKSDWPFVLSYTPNIALGVNVGENDFFAFLDRWGFHLLYACFFCLKSMFKCIKNIIIVTYPSI